MKLIIPSLFVMLVTSTTFSWGAVEFKEAEITTLKNQVQHDTGTGAAPAKVNEKIGENSKVTTAASSMAELTFADTSITRLGANSLFSFQSKERMIKLEKGSVLVNTPPGNGGATVDCGGVTGAVSGTTFMASRDSSGNVMFLMLEGSGVLKVTINTPSGPVSQEIRPGQAATVGNASVQAATSKDDTTPGGGAGGQGPKSSAESGEAGEKPAPQPAPKIQVFDVDVKKIVETAPLIREFKNELPSMEKIEKTIEKQATMVRDGKMEKMEVEVVAVKADGDVLVGSPKVDPMDMKVVNRKEAPSGGLDIDTAAGPGVAENQPRPNSAPAPASAPEAPRVASVPPPPVNTQGIIAGQAGGLASLPPSRLDITVQAGSIKISFDRKVVRDRQVNLSGFAGVSAVVTVPQGSDSVTLTPDPAKIFPGFQSSANLALAQFTLSASSDGLTATASTAPFYPTAMIQAANPTRLLPSATSDALDLAALDAFFFFGAKMNGVTGLPSAFFDSASNLKLADVASGIAVPVNLHVGQDFVFHAGGQVSADPGSVTLTLSPLQPTLAIYGDKISLGTTAAWTGLATGDPSIGSLNYNLLNQNADYNYLFNSTPSPLSPLGFFDSNGDPYAKFNFPIWDDAAGTLANAVTIQVPALTGGLGGIVLASGEDGFRAVGLDIKAGKNRVDVQSAGDLEIKTARISDVGSGTTTDPSLKVDARGKVLVGGASDGEQVRFEGATINTLAGTAAPLPQSLAVVRTADSLELRNLTIRDFAGAKLEKTGTDAGRILLSGSAVRDFKIKELVGAAVNADSKIQMMAVDDAGRLAGDMVVEGRMPVAAKVASALALAGENLPKDTENAMVDAHQIDLAARSVKFQNANLVAMNSITARANTVLIQDSFMTVVRNSGMINLYVQSGLVNRVHGTEQPGMLNFAGTSSFRIGSVLNLTIANSADINTAITSGQMLETSSPQAGKVNVMPYF